MSDPFGDLLKSVPGAKRARRGILIPLEDGGYFHVNRIHDKRNTIGLSSDEMFFLAFCDRNEIIRLRELRSSHDYLLYIRAMAIVDDPRLCRVFDERKAVIKCWSLTQYYNSKNTNKYHYIKALPDRLSKTIKPMAAGLAMIKEPNASCANALLGTVVVVSETLEYLLYFMNLGFYGTQLGVPLEDSISALLIAFRIMLGVESLDFDIDTRGNLPPLIHHQIKDMTNRQIEFVYGHEYAHHLLGHSTSQASSKENSVSPLTNNQPPNQVVLSHQEEFDADYYAITNVEHNLKYKSELANAAIHLLFYLEFLTKLLYKYKHSGIFNNSTHPLHSDRIENLKSKINPSVQPNIGTLDDLVVSAPILSDHLIGMIENPSKFDPIITYGSIYLPTYKNKIQRDRIDF